MKHLALVENNLQPLFSSWGSPGILRTSKGNCRVETRKRAIITVLREGLLPPGELKLMVTVNPSTPKKPKKAYKTKKRKEEPNFSK